MTKREQIRKGIRTLIAIECDGGEFDGKRLTDSILRFEDNMGVAIKIPNPNMTPAAFRMAVEPLIEEEKGVENEMSKV